jgi:hypothetical protein
MAWCISTRVTFSTASNVYWLIMHTFTVYIVSEKKNWYSALLLRMSAAHSWWRGGSTFSLAIFCLPLRQGSEICLKFVRDSRSFIFNLIRRNNSGTQSIPEPY